MKTAISVPDDVFARVDAAAQHLALSRSEFFTIAARRWLDVLDGGSVTDAINQAIDGVPEDHAFTDAAASALVAEADS